MTVTEVLREKPSFQDDARQFHGKRWGHLCLAAQTLVDTIEGELWAVPKGIDPSDWRSWMSREIRPDLYAAASEQACAAAKAVLIMNGVSVDLFPRIMAMTRSWRHELKKACREACRSKV